MTNGPDVGTLWARSGPQAMGLKPLFLILSYTLKRKLKAYN